MFYSDKPINTNTDDKLHRRGFAKLLANTLVNLDSKDAFTVGLFGKWGCGKTSLVNMTLEEIKEIQSKNEIQNKIIIVHFEPWNFTDTNQLLTQFFIRLANEFQNKGDKTLTAIGKALEQYSEAFNLLNLIPDIGSTAISITKWGASKLGQKLQKGLDERDVLKQKNQVIKLLQNQSNRILVVLDDIDRLSNEQIRYVFQLITSVAKFPNTTYLLVFDKEIVVEALKDVQSGNGQDYLEKVIQMPIQIPDIHRSDLHNVLFDYLDKTIANFDGIGFSSKHWQVIFRSCVDPFLKHLRDINRLCNALQFKLTSISTEIDFADMIAVSVLEIHHPMVYEWIKNNKSILTGENDYSTWGNNKTSKDWYNHYSETIQRLIQAERTSLANSDSTELTIQCLADLFPHFGHRIGKTSEVYNLKTFKKNNQIADPSKFDRYFQLDIEGIPYRTSDVRNIVFTWTEEEIAKFILVQEEKQSSYELLEDVSSYISDMTENRAKIVISALIKAIPQLNLTIRKTLFSISTGAYAEHMILNLFDRISAPNRLEFILQLISVSDENTIISISGLINIIELAYGRFSKDEKERDSDKIISIEELIYVETAFSERVIEILKIKNLFSFSEWRIIYRLLKNFRPEYTENYIQKALIDDSNSLHFLGSFINVWTGTSKEYEVLQEYTEYLTTEKVLRAINNCIKNGSLFKYSEDLQKKCAAFFLFATKSSQQYDEIDEDNVSKLLNSWYAEHIAL